MVYLGNVTGEHDFGSLPHSGQQRLQGQLQVGCFVDENERRRKRPTAKNVTGSIVNWLRAEFFDTFSASSGERRSVNAHGIEHRCEVRQRLVGEISGQEPISRPTGTRDRKMANR